MNNKAIVILLTLSLCCLAPTSLFGKNIFGPKTFLMEGNTVETFSNAFEAAPGKAVLIVENGEDMPGQNGMSLTSMASSGSVTLNGTQIFGPADFKQKSRVLEVPVTLNEENVLSVEVRNRGRLVTVRIVSPGCSIEAQPQVIDPNGSATLVWECSDAIGCEITPDLGTVDPNGEKEVSPGQTTSYTLTGIDLYGNACAASTEVSIRPPLAIIVDFPSDQAKVDKPWIDLTGHFVTNAPYIAARINDKKVMVNDNIFLKPGLELSLGENHITLWARDSNDNIARKDIYITRGINPRGWLDLSFDNDPRGEAPLERVLTVHSHLQTDVDWQTAILSETGPSSVSINQIADNQYSLQFPEAGLYTLHYEISDINGDVYSEQRFVSVLDPFTQEDWQEMKNSVRQLEDAYNSLVNTSDIISVRQKILNQAEQNPVFSSVTLCQDAICFRYKGSIPIILDLPDPNSPAYD